MIKRTWFVVVNDRYIEKLDITFDKSPTELEEEKAAKSAADGFIKSHNVESVELFRGVIKSGYRRRVIYDEYPYEGES